MTENKINNILDSLDGIKQAGARPFMYTRVMARMQQDDVKSVWGRIVAFIARPVVACACLTTIIATNIYFVINAEKETEMASGSSATVSEVFPQSENLVLAVNNLEPVSE